MLYANTNRMYSVPVLLYVKLYCNFKEVQFGAMNRRCVHIVITKVNKKSIYALNFLAMNAYIRLLFVLLAASTMMFALSAGSSPFDRAIGVCIRNCAQCKKMFGPYFLGQKCADSCVKYKGKLIPDCEDEGSIQPFLQALDSDY